MGKKVTLSVIILEGGKFDNEVYKKTLASVSWVPEVIKLKTGEKITDFAELRNSGAAKANGEWLFYLDTDEIVTDGLQREIQNAIASDKYSGYAIPRRNIVLGREMKHCGLWPDYVLRLIKKDAFNGWRGELHEQPVVKGKIHHMTEPLIHQKHDNLTDMVEKTNKWSEIEAKLMYEADHPKMNFLRFFSAGMREFWLRMIVQTAFLDGVEGTIYGLYQVFSRLISYSKLWELQIRVSNSVEKS
jgi:hypothetical protein